MMFVEAPILVAIWTSIVAVTKTIWDAMVKSASRAAFYFATVVPMILKWFLKYRAFSLALVISIAVIIRNMFRLAYGVVNQSLNVANHLQWFVTQFKWMYWLLIDGPLALDVAYDKLGDLFSLWLSLLLVRWAWMKSRWAIFVAEKKFQSRR